MLRSPNSATPLTGVTDVVPESLPPTGLVPIATVTLAVKLVSTLPRVSCTWTWIAGVITLPGVAVLGWTLKTRTSVAVPPVVPMANPRVSGSVPGKQPAAARATRATARGASFISIRRLSCQECSRLRTAIERPVREQGARYALVQLPGHIRRERPDAVLERSGTSRCAPWLEPLVAIDQARKGLKPGSTPAGAAALKDRIGALP